MMTLRVKILYPPTNSRYLPKVEGKKKSPRSHAKGLLALKQGEKARK